MEAISSKYVNFPAKGTAQDQIDFMCKTHEISRADLCDKTGLTLDELNDPHLVRLTSSFEMLSSHPEFHEFALMMLLTNLSGDERLGLRRLLNESVNRSETTS